MTTLETNTPWSAFIPYGAYWSTPFAKWQGSLANLNAVQLERPCAAAGAGRAPRAAEAIDLAILGITNPQRAASTACPG